MILEIADFRILAGQQAGFEAAIQQAMATVISRAQGFRGAVLHHGIESPERYVLQVQWDSLEAHTQGFRQSPLYTEWRGLIGPFFAGPPQVEHFEMPPLATA
jgi:heme-degrading monooxygenase HmoA